MLPGALQGAKMRFALFCKMRLNAFKRLAIAKMQGKARQGKAMTENRVKTPYFASLIIYNSLGAKFNINTVRFL